MNNISDQALRDEIKNHPEQLYRRTCDPELDRMLEELRTMPIELYTPPPSKKLCLEIASKVPCATMRELFDNAEKIRQYLSE